MQTDFPIDLSENHEMPLNLPSRILRNAYSNLPRKFFCGFHDFLKLFLQHLTIAVINEARIIIKKDINVM